MSTIEPIEVFVRTNALRQILDENPEIKLKLQNMACEKIAEELKRKIGSLTVDRFRTEIQATIDKSMAECNKNLTSQYKFPPEARQIIDLIAKETVEKYFNAEIRRWENSINEFFAAKQAESDKRTEEKVKKTMEELRPLIKQQAREEFFEVLEKANGLKAPRN